MPSYLPKEKILLQTCEIFAKVIEYLSRPIDDKNILLKVSTKVARSTFFNIKYKIWKLFLKNMSRSYTVLKTSDIMKNEWSDTDKWKCIWCSNNKP